MQSHYVVDYDQLVSEYNASLTTVLRGFRTGPEFLEIWVPDEDDIRGILNIVEAAADAGMEAITVLVEARTLECLDEQRLCQVVEPYGELSAKLVGERTAFHVALGAGSGARRLAPIPISTRGGRHVVRTARSRAPEAQSTENLERGDGLCVDRKSPYVAKLHQCTDTAPRSGSLGEAPFDCVRVDCQTGGVVLSVWIETRHHRIRCARHDGSQELALTRLLDLLCVVLEGKPIQECSDHAIIRLEYQLRNSMRPVLGIVTPAAADPIFELPVHLVRGLAADYRDITGSDHQGNYYREAASCQWRTMAAEERAHLVQQAIKSFPSQFKVCLLELDEENRAFLQLEDGGKQEAQSSYLLGLEAHLQRTVEPNLHLFVRSRIDQNKLRQKGVQST